MVKMIKEAKLRVAGVWVGLVTRYKNNFRNTMYKTEKKHYYYHHH